MMTKLVTIPLLAIALHVQVLVLTMTKGHTDHVEIPFPSYFLAKKRELTKKDFHHSTSPKPNI